MSLLSGYPKQLSESLTGAGGSLLRQFVHVTADKRPQFLIGYCPEAKDPGHTPLHTMTGGFPQSE